MNVRIQIPRPVGVLKTGKKFTFNTDKVSDSGENNNFLR